MSKRRGLVYVCIVYTIDFFACNLYVYILYSILYRFIHIYIGTIPSNSHHQDYSLLVGNPCKPSFVAVTGWQVDQTCIYPKCTKTEPANVFHSFMMDAILSPGSFGIDPLLLGVFHHKKKTGWTSTATDMQDLMDGCCCYCCCCCCGERKTGRQCYP